MFAGRDVCGSYFKQKKQLFSVWEKMKGGNISSAVPDNFIFRHGPQGAGYWIFSEGFKLCKEAQIGPTTDVKHHKALVRSVSKES